MMALNGKMHFSQILPLGELSNLPKIALDEILVRLPLRDAVRTSILSKNWRYNWCRIPELKLDETVWMKKDSTSDTRNPRKIIYHILTHHVGPIAKFDLSLILYRGHPNIGSADIDNLIYFLSRHDIVHLVLSLSEADTYRLPSSFFTCLQLRYLALRNCLLLPPPTFKGFERLTSLRLDRVRISSRALESLIANSSLLKKLVMYIPDVHGVVEINAPMLRTFDFHGNLRFLCFKNVPLLSKLSLTDIEYFGMDWDAGRDLVKFLQPLSALEHLKVEYMWCLSQEPGLAPPRLPCDLNRVKYFSTCVYLSRSNEVSLTLCLIRSFPYLQKLEIEVSGEEKEDLPALDCLEVESFSDVTLDHLREVKLTNIFGTDPDFQLIKLLLAKSPVLERMQIELGFEEVDGELVWLDGKPVPVKIEESKVFKFQRASPSAEIFIK